MEFANVFLKWLLLTGTILFLTWKLTDGVQRRWLRYFPRAVAAALAVTPTLVSLSVDEDKWPLPAGWVLFCAIALDDPEERLLDFIYGGTPLVVVSIVVWCILMVLTRPEQKVHGIEADMGR